MSIAPPSDWETQNPNTAALLRKWGSPIPQSAKTKPQPVTAAPVAEPMATQTTPAMEAGIRTRETIGKALAPIAASPTMQFTQGFGEGLVHFAKGTFDVAKMVATPGRAAEFLTGLASGAYQTLRNLDVSTLPASARPIIQSAIKAFEENPSRSAGRLVSEALLLVAPGKMLGAAKSLAKMGRTGEAAAPVARAAEAVSPMARVAAQVAPVIEEAAPAAPALAKPRLAPLIEKAQAEEAALRGARTQATLKAREVRARVPAPVAPVTEPAATVPVVGETLPPAARTTEAQVAAAPVSRPVSLPPVEVPPAVAAQSTPVVPATKVSVAKRGTMVTGEGINPVTGETLPPVRSAEAQAARRPAPVREPQPDIGANLVKRLEGVGLSTDEAMSLVQRGETKEIMRLLTQRQKRLPVAEPPEPVQAAPVAPEVAPAAPAQVTTAPPAAAIPEAPTLEVPLPARQVPPATTAEVAAAEQAAGAVQRQKEFLKTRLTKLRAGEVSQPVPVVPEAAPAIKIAEGQAERLPGQGVQLQPIESSQFEAAGYSPQTRELVVKYKREPFPRTLSNVTQEEADRFFAAESKGKVFNEMFRGRPQYRPGGTDMDLKKAQDTVEGMIYNGARDADIAKGMSAKLRAIGIESPSQFIAQVRQARGVPEDIEQFARKAQAWKLAQKRAVSEAPATELAPLDPREIAIQREVTKAAGGPDFVPPEIRGGADVKRLYGHLSPIEMGNRIAPELGDSLMRIDTIKEQAVAPAFMRLAKAGWKRMTPEQDRNVFETILGRAQPTSPVAAAAMQEIRDIQGKLGDQSVSLFMRLSKGIDPWRVDKFTARQIANMWVKQGLPGEQAMRSAEALKKLVSEGRGTGKFFRSGNFLIPPYEIMRPMQQVVPTFLERAAQQFGIKQLYGSTPVFERVLAMTAGKHPDAELFMQVVDQWLGKGAPVDQIARQVRDVGRLANAVAVTVLSPVTSVKQLSQIAFSAMNLPARDMVVGIGKMFTTEGWRGARAQAAMLTEARELSGSLLSQLDDATKVGRVAEWVSEKVAGPIIKITGISTVDNFARGVAYWARKSELTRLAKVYKTNPGAARRLMKAGVNLEAPSLAEEINMSAKEFADVYNLRSNILHSPAYLSQPYFQTARGLQMFAINMTKLLYREVLYPTMRPENFNAFLEQMMRNARLAGYGTMVGALVNRTERAMKMHEQPHGPLAELLGAIASIGALGVFDRTLNGLVDKDGNVIPLEQWPKNIAKQIESIGTNLVSGAGPVIISGMPRKLLSKPASLIPGIGGLVQSWIDAGNR